MTDEAPEYLPPFWTGEGEFEFGQWTTPFAEDPVNILDVTYGRSKTYDVTVGSTLVVRLAVSKSNYIYQVAFSRVSAFRVLDEHGLTEFWQKTADLGRPAMTTFRVRNDAWSKDSMISFMPTEGWSFVIATDDDCLQAVAEGEPAVTRALRSDGER